jgi:dynein regulatory complex protein 1
VPLLSAEIKMELKKKDDEFVRTLKKQAEDIDTLLQYMSRQFVEMQNSYKDELDEIENAFLAVRVSLGVLGYAITTALAITTYLWCIYRV